MIKLFNENDSIFETNGEVVLNPTYAVVHKEDNGDYYLDLETQLTEETKTIPAEDGITLEINEYAKITANGNKEAEITTLKGNTTQDGTPTPETPIPINVVTGRQEINIYNKNFLGQENISSLSTATGTFTGTTLNYSSTGTYKKVEWFIPVKAGEKYTISFTPNTSLYYTVYEMSQISTSVSYRIYNHRQDSTCQANRTPFTFTIQNDCYLRIYIGSSTAQETTLEKLQLEKGEEQTTCVEHKGISQEINLGKNLLDRPSAYSITTWEETSVNIPKGTYTISCTDLTTDATSGTSSLMQFYHSDGTLNDIYFSHSNKVGTITTTDDVVKVRIYSSSSWANSNGKTTTFTNLMIEKGSQATPYSAYFEPIELCKIGDYQDYIYKNNNKWYIGKKIGKVVLNGSENWSIASSIMTGTSRFYIAYNSIINGGDESTNKNVYTYSNNFKGTYWYDLYNDNTTDKNLISNYNNSSPSVKRIVIRIDNTYASDVATFKTWLSTHNTIVYYVLATPTNTEITNNELLGQLENFILLNGLNNIAITSANLTTPLTIHYDYVTGGEVSLNDFIQPNKILVANTPTGNQPFRITSIEKTRRKIKLQAKHLSYDTENYVIDDSYVVDKTCNQALDHLNSATDNPSPFTMTSDITTINSYRCVRKSLWEAINVVLERWGGHLTRNNWQIGVMNSIGTDNGVVVRYAKNLKNIDVQYDWSNVVTKILPVGYDGLTLDGLYLYSETQYDIPYTKVVHFTQDIDDTPYRDENGQLDEEAYTEALKNDLTQQAIAYLNEYCVPKVNYELNANLEKITDVGDTIQVIDERLGINLMTSLISYDYDCILEKYTQLQFGNFKKTISDLSSYINTTSTEIATEVTNTTKVTLQNELQTATSQIWGVLGNSYVLVEGDKILIVDSLPKETATNVWLFNNGGLAFSNTGINGTFKQAWTIDGTFNTQNINVINFTADLIKGGALKLGSNLNQNGILEVYDEANNLIAQLDKNGIRMNATDGGYILINTTVGFAGYDRNDNKIYWADGDEFHMKKSVVEEEITLVDKMTIIPITITDQNDNITSDGIGFVSTL